MTDFSRRRALRVLAAPAALAAVPAAAQTSPPAPSANTVTLLLVNDIYKMNEEKGRGGWPRLASIVRAERARGAPLLFAHAGDMFSPSLMSGFDQGEHTVELTNMIRPDIFVPGNHEFDFGKEVFLKRMAEANFPFFAANIREANGGAVANLRDSAVVELGPVKIGLIGLALTETPSISSPGDLRFLPVMDTLREQAKKVRDAGADIVVAVAHTDFATDMAIVRSRLVDVLLTGHDHDLRVSYDGRTVMVESSEEGNYVTAIDLRLEITGEGANRRVAFTPTFRVNDSKDVTPDPAVLERVKGYEGQLSRELDVEIATLLEPLDTRTSQVRSTETAFGNLVADALRSATGAEIALTNGGGIRANRQYPSGHRLTRRDVLAELPFGNRTVVFDITGKDLKAALENGVSQVEQRAGRFPQVSGLRFTYDPKLAAGSRVVSVEVGGQPLDEGRTYRMASNDFMLKGGDGYGSLAGSVKLSNLDLQGRLMANDVMTYARRLGTIELKPEGRVTSR